MNREDARKWKRYNFEKLANIKTAKHTHSRDINDMSAGGASIQGDILEFEDEVIEIITDDFGNLTGSIIREWDDGFAVKFDLDEEDKYSLQEDLEAFRRENDLMQG